MFCLVFVLKKCQQQSFRTGLLLRNLLTGVEVAWPLLEDQMCFVACCYHCFLWCWGKNVRTRTRTCWKITNHSTAELQARSSEPTRFNQQEGYTCPGILFSGWGTQGGCHKNGEKIACVDLFFCVPSISTSWYLFISYFHPKSIVALRAKLLLWAPVERHREDNPQMARN